MADAGFTALEAPRLVLRRLRPSDLGAFCAYRSDPEVARYQDWLAWTPADGERFLERQLRLHPDVPGTWFQFGVELKAGGVLAGDCGLHCRQDDPRQMEVGITLARAHQGKGYGRDALTRLLDYVFFTLGKHRVSATTDADNAAAARLLERVGMRREGHFVRSVWFKGGWGSEYAYAVLGEEWGRRRGPDAGEGR
jgi:RimJ/RimL family protein N-acetyltransferase